MKTLVIIPAYNEEESILRVVRNLENADIDCDYIVINDCSKDSTGKILDDNKIEVCYPNTEAVTPGQQVVIYDGNIGSVQREKDSVKEVKKGLECGITIENFNDIKVGDIIESYEMVEKER